MTATKKIPALRFAEFEEEWEEDKIGNHVDFLSGYPFESEEISEINNGPLLMRGVNITEGTIRHSADIDRFFNGDTSSLRKYFVEKGDVVIGMDGSKVGRNSALINDKNSGSLLVQRVARLREKNGSSLPFIYQHINSNLFHRYVDQVKTSSGIPHISAQNIKDFTIYFPSLPEQQKIASFLTSVDNKIQQLTKKKALLEAYKKGLMQGLFSQQLRFKDDEGNDYPDWEEKKLGEMATFLKGKGIAKADIAADGSLECIRYGELYTHYNETIKDVVSRTNLKPDDLVLSEYNDVIIPGSGETQLDIATASCVLKDGVALGGDLNIIRSGINGVFLAFYLNNVKKYEIAILAQGNAVVHLYASQLETLTIEVPSKDEQQKIANVLTSVDNKINLVAKQLDKTSAFKKGLLQQMFI